MNENQIPPDIKKWIDNHDVTISHDGNEQGDYEYGYKVGATEMYLKLSGEIKQLKEENEILKKLYDTKPILKISNGITPS